MSGTLYKVEVSGMQSAQVGLTTTGNNLANVNPAGYTRQQVVQSASTPVFSGAGFVGTGANVETVRRVYTGVLSNQAITKIMAKSLFDFL